MCPEKQNRPPYSCVSWPRTRPLPLLSPVQWAVHRVRGCLRCGLPPGGSCFRTSSAAAGSHCLDDPVFPLKPVAKREVTETVQHSFNCLKVSFQVLKLGFDPFADRLF